jgi:hypothetical protein
MSGILLFSFRKWVRTFFLSGQFSAIRNLRALGRALMKIEAQTAKHILISRIAISAAGHLLRDSRGIYHDTYRNSAPPEGLQKVIAREIQRGVLGYYKRC